jgi:signal transduction histidine kinase
MTRRLLATYVTITVFVLLVLEVPFAITFASREQNRFLAAIERDARVLAAQVEEPLEVGVIEPIPAVVERYVATVRGGRVVVLDADGIAVADSGDPFGAGETYLNRPEVVTALDGGTATGVRRSDTTGSDLIYAAVPIASGGTVHGALRITYPASELDRRTRENLLRLAGLAVVVIIGVVAVGLLLARSVTAPIAVLRQATMRIAKGDLHARAKLDRGPPEIRALGTDFDDMAARLETLVSGQQAFVADASHQLRTPLTALRLRLEGLEPAVHDAGAAAQADLDAALDETERLARLVDGLLALARAGTSTPTFAAVDAVATSRERADTWTPLAEERGITLTVVAPPTAVPVRMVVGGLEQVLDNLLANALDAVPDGAPIRVSVRVADDQVAMVAVDDGGPGLDVADRARAMDRFWRSPSAAPGGSGLGLAIVADLVRSSGGSVALHRSDLGGLCVSVSLPLA